MRKTAFGLIALENMGTVTDVEKQLGVVERYLDQLPDRVLSLGVRAILAIVVLLIGSRLIAFVGRIIRGALERSSASTEAVQFLDSAMKALLYLVLTFTILQLFGMDAASFATVIGSVGVTVGLAVQGSLTNCIGGILILTLKPFKVGDYIIEDTNKNEGVVQQISIFYTKLATGDNKVILIPNGTLANSSLTNVTDEPERRVDFQVGISYRADIRKAKETVMKLLEEHPATLEQRERNVYVDSLGDSSVVLGIRFWTKKEDYWKTRWEILENIKYAFDGAGIEIPYPQLDVHFNDAGSRGRDEKISGF